MSITPERLAEITLTVAQSMGQESIDDATIHFASALLAAVEAELKPVLWQWREGDNPFGLDHTYEHEVIATTDYSEVRKLISLPLIKEKS